MISAAKCFAGITGAPHNLPRAVEALHGSGGFYCLIGRVAVNPQKLRAAAHAPLHAARRAHDETDLLRFCTSHSELPDMLPVALFPPAHPLRNPA